MEAVYLLIDIRYQQYTAFYLAIFVIIIIHYENY